MEIELIECFPGTNLRNARLSQHLVEQRNFRRRYPVELRQLAEATIRETPADEVARRMEVRNQKLITGII